MSRPCPVPATTAKRPGHTAACVAEAGPAGGGRRDLRPRARPPCPAGPSRERVDTSDFPRGLTRKGEAASPELGGPGAPSSSRPLSAAASLPRRPARGSPCAPARRPPSVQPAPRPAPAPSRPFAPESGVARPGLVCSVSGAACRRLLTSEALLGIDSPDKHSALSPSPALPGPPPGSDSATQTGRAPGRPVRRTHSCVHVRPLRVKLP